MRQPRTMPDDLFARAAYDEQRDCEVTYGVKWTVCLSTTFQRGVYELSLTAYATVGPRKGAVVASYKASWPNSSTLAFGSFLYQCSHRMSRMVENWALDVGKEEAGRLNR